MTVSYSAPAAKETCIITHRADCDGWFSGIVAWLATKNPVVIGHDYKDPFPWEKIPPKAPVILLDLVVQPYEEMRKFEKRGHHLTWIDHHSTAIDNVRRVGLTPDGIRATHSSACKLAWKYFFPKRNVPEAIELASCFDTWQWVKEKNERARLFTYGCSSIETNPETEEGRTNLLELIYCKERREEIIEAGQHIKGFLKEKGKEICQEMLFETTLRGLPVMACNYRLIDSTIFDNAREKFPHCKAILVFGWFRDKWKCSLYTEEEDIHCGKIASRFGGGGHQKAASWRCQKLPFKLIRQE